MMTPTTRTVHKLAIFALLLAMATTETFVSAGFLIGPSSSARQDHPRYSAKSHRGFGRNADNGDDEQLKDCGGAVAGLFGNLRIPASLIAGASLGSAFALPMVDTDGFQFGFAKRMYAFSMITSLGSMLLVVIVSTICMNDITVCPTRLSKSVRDYIDENYSLEWMAVKSHFYYGNLAFIVGSAFRAWISIACPVVGKGVLGILSSLTLLSFSILVEKSRKQAGVPIQQSFLRFLKAIATKAKTNALFGVAAILWATTVTYLVVKIPQMYRYLSLM